MAPSTTSALHPIVIPAVQIPPHFTTLGSGLLHASHPREPVSSLRTLLLSHPPILDNKSKPKPWWRAQCLLYGLSAPEKRTVTELRGALELALLKGTLQVPTEMVELEHKENGKFRKLNAQVREATVAGRDTKAKASSKGKGKNKPRVQGNDPLKGPMNPGKVTKSRPAKKMTTKSDGVTVNFTINMPSGESSRSEEPAKKKQRAKRPPKPRAKKATGVAAPAYSGSAVQPEVLEVLDDDEQREAEQEADRYAYLAQFDAYAEYESDGEEDHYEDDSHCRVHGQYDGEEGYYSPY